MSNRYRCIFCGKLVGHEYLHYLTHPIICAALFMAGFLLLFFIAGIILLKIFDKLGRYLVVHHKTQTRH